MVEERETNNENRFQLPENTQAFSSSLVTNINDSTTGRMLVDRIKRIPLSGRATLGIKVQPFPQRTRLRIEINSRNFLAHGKRKSNRTGKMDNVMTRVKEKARERKLFFCSTSRCKCETRQRDIQTDQTKREFSKSRDFEGESEDSPVGLNAMTTSLRGDLRQHDNAIAGKDTPRRLNRPEKRTDDA